MGASHFGSLLWTTRQERVVGNVKLKAPKNMLKGLVYKPMLFFVVSYFNLMAFYLQFRHYPPLSHFFHMAWQAYGLGSLLPRISEELILHLNWDVRHWGYGRCLRGCVQRNCVHDFSTMNSASSTRCSQEVFIGILPIELLIWISFVPLNKLWGR